MKAKSRARSGAPGPEKPVTLKFLAEHLHLSPATVSIVLNNSPVANSIPSVTKQRIHAAAKQFSYRPNLHARMLRSRITNTIGVIIPELSEGYVTGVMLGVEQYLLQEGFLSFTVSHLGQPDLREEYQELLMRRRVDGLLLLNSDASIKVPLPVVGVSTHSKSIGVSNVVLDHLAAARMALRHLHDLGHQRIAFMKGQRYSLDSEVRWQAIVGIAHEIGIEVHAELCIFLEENIWTPELGYRPVRDLLTRTHDFTALFCLTTLQRLALFAPFRMPASPARAISRSLVLTTLSLRSTLTLASQQSASLSDRWVGPLLSFWFSASTHRRNLILKTSTSSRS